MRGLADKTVLVTGAAGGLGSAIARAFAEAGGRIILTDIAEDRLQPVADEIASAGRNVRLEVADLSSREACHALAARCLDADILINNAALTVMKIQSVVVRDDEFWDKMFAINLHAPIALMQGIVPAMTARGYGVVVNISSVNATRGTVDNAPYAAAKAALEMTSKVLAMELGQRRTGVRVNCIAPGFIRTVALARHFKHEAQQHAAAQVAIPLGRVIEPAEVAEACLFLASDSAAAMLGSILTIDGGMNAGAYAFDTSNYSDQPLADEHG